MQVHARIPSTGRWPRAVAACAVALAGLLAGACAQMGSTEGLLGASQAPNLAEATNPKPKDDRTELQKATEHWGKELGKDPRNAKNALNYARNLKAMGEKRQALAVLQQASVFHGGNRELNSEYGRLALEFDQVNLAGKLLEQADDPANPDWRVISARGTVLAKQGLYRDAIPFYERARALAPEQASILNNLALAYAMEGKADAAEPLLKRAAADGAHEDRVRQNLALVLGLQGKHDEAKRTTGPNADKSVANAEYVQSMVKAAPITTAATAEPAAPKASGEWQVQAKPSPAAKLAGNERAEDDVAGWTTQVKGKR